MRAVITHEVELKFGPVENQTDEPLMRLETGEEVNAYYVDRYVPLGTQGDAEWLEDRKCWKFIPDPEEELDPRIIGNQIPQGYLAEGIDKGTTNEESGTDSEETS